MNDAPIYGTFLNYKYIKAKNGETLNKKSMLRIVAEFIRRSHTPMLNMRLDKIVKVDRYWKTKRAEHNGLPLPEITIIDEGKYEADIIFHDGLYLCAVEIKTNLRDFKNDFKKKHYRDFPCIEAFYYAFPKNLYDNHRKEILQILINASRKYKTGKIGVFTICHEQLFDESRFLISQERMGTRRKNAEEIEILTLIHLWRLGAIKWMDVSKKPSEHRCMLDEPQPSALPDDMLVKAIDGEILNEKSMQRVIAEFVGRRRVPVPNIRLNHIARSDRLNKAFDAKRNGNPLPKEPPKDAGNYEADLLFCEDKYLSEVEMKTDFRDFRDDFNKKHYHDFPCVESLYYAFPKDLYDHHKSEIEQILINAQWDHKTGEIGVFTIQPIQQENKPYFRVKIERHATKREDAEEIHINALIGLWKIGTTRWINR